MWCLFSSSRRGHIDRVLLLKHGRRICSARLVDHLEKIWRAQSRLSLSSRRFAQKYRNCAKCDHVPTKRWLTCVRAIRAGKWPARCAPTFPFRPATTSAFPRAISDLTGIRRASASAARHLVPPQQEPMRINGFQFSRILRKIAALRNEQWLRVLQVRLTCMRSRNPGCTAQGRRWGTCYGAAAVLAVGASSPARAQAISPLTPPASPPWNAERVFEPVPYAQLWSHYPGEKIAPEGRTRR